MENWKTELDEHFKEKKQAEKELEDKKQGLHKSAKRFMKKTALPAFEELAEELARHKRKTAIDQKKDRIALMVRHNKKKEFVYEISLSQEGEHLTASRGAYLPNEKGKLKLGIEGKIHTSSNFAQVEKMESADIIADFLQTYKQTTHSR